MRLIIAFMLASFLSACGVQGDLYLENQPNIKHETEDKTPRPARAWEEDGGDFNRLDR